MPDGAYSPLESDQQDNVKNLTLAWSRAMAPGNNEITPIVYNGVMYLANPNDVIQAIDADTGDLLWEYKHPLPPRETLHNNQGEHNSSSSRLRQFRHLRHVRQHRRRAGCDAQASACGSRRVAETAMSPIRPVVIGRQRHDDRRQHGERLWRRLCQRP
jgi:hypothetical protein